MPFQVDWLLPNRILYIHESGILSEADLHTINHDLSILLDQQVPPNPLHLLIDHQELEHHPPNIPALKRLLVLLTHPALGWTIIIGEESNLWKFLAVTVENFTGSQLERADTLPEALQRLMEVDASLPDLR